MPSLVEIGRNIYDKETFSNLEPDLVALEEELRGDEDSRLAKTMLQMIDDGMLLDEDDLQEFQVMVNEYMASKQQQPMFPGIEYTFTPPNELMSELDVLEERFPGLNKEPSGDPIGEALPVIEVSDEEEDFEAILAQVAQTGSPYRTPGFEVELTPAPRQELPLKTASVYLPNVGRIDYDVESVVKTRFSINLVFDPSRAKPPFYPEVGLQFELEAEGTTYGVMYAGVCFDYMSKRFMSFSILGTE
jgi:hypothetical protein